MPINRRAFILKSVMLSGYGISLLSANTVFAQDALQETIDNLVKGKKTTDSDKITLKIPKIAENGAVVPISVSTSLVNVESIAILVPKNPIPLSAKFKLTGDLEPFVSTRIKMAATSDVIVLVETSDAVYRSTEHVSVTIGGCGD